jgi:hypothetical protein
MALTFRWWDRGDLGTAQIDHCDTTTQYMGGVQPSIDPQGHLLRSRFYPSVTLKATSVTTVDPTHWMNVNLEFVAWYDLNGPGILPQPTDTDARIVCTGLLYPNYTPSPNNATTAYQVRWEPREGVLQSFGQRNPNNTAVNAGVFTGFFLADFLGTFYTHRATTLFQSVGYADVLWGI